MENYYTLIAIYFFWGGSGQFTAFQLVLPDESLNSINITYYCMNSEKEITTADSKESTARYMTPKLNLKFNQP